MSQLSSNHKQYRCVIVTEDFDKVLSLAHRIVKEHYAEIQRYTIEKSMNRMEIVFNGGDFIRWIYPSEHERGHKFNKLLCDKNILNTHIFNFVIMPGYSGEYEDIIWI